MPRPHDFVPGMLQLGRPYGTDAYTHTTPPLECWAANLSLAECRCIQGTDSQPCYFYWELPPLLVFTLQRFRPVHDHHGIFLYAVKVTQAGCHRVTTRNA